MLGAALAAAPCGSARADTTLAALARDYAQAFAALERHEIVALALTLSILLFAVLAAILLVRTRVSAADTERELRAENHNLRLAADRARALLMAEPQVLVAWDADSDGRPEIIGDPAQLVSADAAPRLLAFGTWLPPAPALALDHAVDALRATGEAFAMTVPTLAGRSVEAAGRVVGGQAILRLRELSGVRRELAESALRQRAALEEGELLRGLVAALPWPVWARRADGTLAYVNPAYARAVDAGDATDAMRRGIDLLDSTDRDAMIAAFTRNQGFAARLPVVVGGAKRMLDVHAVRLASGSAAIAVDASEAAGSAATLTRMAEAHRRTLNQLATAVAVFDETRKLVFYNDSYRQLWDLEAAFLDTRPNDGAVLDRLRAARRLPEEQDFRQWKARLHDAYQSIEARADTWHLPDGRTLRMVTTPNIEGGVTYLFDDVTERLDLARRFDALIRVQRETLDNLAEGVAVFGSNGRIQLFNPAFARLWNLAPEALADEPHIETIEAWCAPLYDDSPTWHALHGTIAGIEHRASLRLRIERKDGSVLDCITIPLPEGATLVTFQDITAPENVERALRERNEALEVADRVKVDFVHHVSYELRSPLTTLIGFAHFLNDPATGTLNARQHEYLSYITTSTNTLLAIINNILDLATIDAGAMTLSLGEVDAARAVAAAAEGIQDRLVTDNIRLDVRIDPDVGTFVADERRVIQVLYNLLANAAGFSPQGAAITVAAWRADGAVVFSVTDLGPGIPADVKAKVFDWFESHSNGSRHRGAGLGLSLVRSFVELHGGVVRVDSPVGKGTTVTCTFPVDQAAHRVAAQ